MQCAVFRRTAIPAVLAALALLASAACSGGDGASKGSAGANPAVATEPPRTNPTLATVPAPTTTTNPYAVPAVIDAAYVNRVLASLDALLGDVLRIVKRTNTIPQEAYDRLKAVYIEPEFLQLRIDSFQRDIREGFRGYRPDPGNKASTVLRILTTRPSCIFVEVRRDYSAVGLNARTSTEWVALTKHDPSRDPSRYNATPWAMTYDGFPPDRSQPPDPCAS
jgi:hypothetical protein